MRQSIWTGQKQAQALEQEYTPKGSIWNIHPHWENILQSSWLNLWRYWRAEKNVKNKCILFVTDSKVIFLVLRTYKLTLKLLVKAHEILSSISNLTQWRGPWVKGYQDNIGNSTADKLPRECALGSYSPETFLLLTIETLGFLVNPCT